MLRRLILIAAIVALGVSTPSDAQDASAATDNFAALETIVVSGEQPGPGLWKISKGGHVMWLLGTLSPLPSKMVWKSDEIEQVIAQSGEVVLAPKARLTVKGGSVRMLFLMPSLLGARNNPGKAKLVDVVPAELYQRWSALKKTYLGRDAGVEKRRPIFAAGELYEKAIKKSGLDSSDAVSAAVLKIAKKSDIPITSPSFTVHIEEPKATLREFSKSPLDDLECFRKTIEHLETDLATMKARGNAWATGDIQALHDMPFTDQNQACRDAILHASIVEERGLSDLRSRAIEAWITAATTAIEKHPVSFGILSIGLASNEDGILPMLQQRGYTIEAPWEQVPE